MFQVGNYLKICFITLQEQLMRSGFNSNGCDWTAPSLLFFKTT